MGGEDGGGGSGGGDGGGGGDGSGSSCTCARVVGQGRILCPQTSYNGYNYTLPSLLMKKRRRRKSIICEFFNAQSTLKDQSIAR